MAKIKIEMDLEDFGKDLDYPFSKMLKEEVLYIVRDAIREELGKQTRRELAKWVKNEFLGKGELVVKDGVVHVPLLLGEIQHG